MSDLRTPIVEITRRVGISGAAIQQRLRKLEKWGSISGSKFVINPKVLRDTTMDLIGIYLDKAMISPEAGKQLKQDSRSY